MIPVDDFRPILTGKGIQNLGVGLSLDEEQIAFPEAAYSPCERLSRGVDELDHLSLVEVSGHFAQTAGKQAASV